MPQRKSASTLYNLCLQTTGKNIKLWSRDSKSSPLNYLSRNVTTDLCELLKNDEKLRKPQLDIFINATTISLDLSNFRNNPTSYAIKRICCVCENLKSLDLFFTEVSEKDLVKLSQSIPSIVCLNFNLTGCTDVVMSVLGSHCPKLRDLDVSCCPVSDQGIRAFCKNRNTCKNSVEDASCHDMVSLKIDSTRVSDYGASIALRRFPNLQVLSFENSFQTLTKLHNDKDLESVKLLTPYKLKRLKCDCHRKGVISTLTIHIATFLCPLVTTLEFTNISINDDCVLLLANFCHLEDLAFSSLRGTTFKNGIVPLFQKIGGNLDYIKFHSLTDINVSMIGVLCPKLQNLFLYGNKRYVTTSCTKKINHKPFSELCDLGISCDENEDVPPTHLRLILSNCINIVKLELTHCVTLTDELFGNVLTENSFSSLNCLNLQCCFNFSPKSILSLLSLPNPLRFLEYYANVSENERKKMKNYIKNENLDVDFEIGLIF